MCRAVLFLAMRALFIFFCLSYSFIHTEKSEQTNKTRKKKQRICYLIISDLVNLCKMRYSLNLINSSSEMNSFVGYINLIASLSRGNLFKHLILCGQNTHKYTHFFSLLVWPFFPCQYLIF